jgi:hypothetical protein
LPFAADALATGQDATVIGGFRHSDRNGAIQPHLDQMQHAPINDPARHRLQLSFSSSLKTERVARKSIVPGMRPEQMCLTSSGAT